MIKAECMQCLETYTAGCIRGNYFVVNQLLQYGCFSNFVVVARWMFFKFGCCCQMDVANGGGLQLTNFAISHVGHITIDVSGLGPLDWILELLVDFVDTFLKVPRTNLIIN